MKTKLISGIVILFLVLSCDSSFEDLNNNQNSITTDEVIPPKVLLKGTMLADIALNNGHLQRIAGMWTGQYRGEIALYLGLYNYDISSSESDSDWTYLYNGMIKQFREIEKYYETNKNDPPEQKLITGICKVLEAHAVGTATSIWGDIPYSEAVNPAISDPVFDKQSIIYKKLQEKLDEAIVLLNDPITKVTIPSTELTEDIFFAGYKEKWIKTAYTLKARYYLQTREYLKAYDAALKGISDNAGSMKFTPLITAATGTENLLYRFMAGTRVGYLSVNNTFCRNLLDQTSSTTISRRNAKTNEAARRNHLNAGSIFGTRTNTIINGEFKPMDLVTYQENLLILAEAAARTGNPTEGLLQLNKVRVFLASDDNFIRRSEADKRIYDAYDAGDFAKRKSGVTITGTAGQFTCSAATTTIEVGHAIVISGTLAGTGAINGYTSPKTYYVKTTNGTTTFQLSATKSGTLVGTAITTTVGTTTGLTFSGMENPDNIDSTRALLREIIEERYVTGFGTFMPWNDARRLRKSEPDIAVPIPFNNATATKHPERFIISQDEINSNSNAPKGLTIYSPTELNE